MNQLNLMQQILQFQKTTAKNSLRSTNLLLEHGERLSFAWLDRFSLLPGQTRETATLWLDVARTWRSYCLTTTNALFEPFDQFNKS
ncbi:hypothetical protein DSLASN_15910 [Desulfoluna limicola]|uniref:Uncharacterized protein n=1 Tax=Desulfoluna limicola TaxID=2810562 RepID=A0ABN6F068_9BACT|nr:hypothetical protein [Desulfoluna limicola]BCS95959.1 hypothetical protein DSLASN_15910 [Desulfoluna limicola]